MIHAYWLIPTAVVAACFGFMMAATFEASSQREAAWMRMKGERK